MSSSVTYIHLPWCFSCAGNWGIVGTLGRRQEDFWNLSQWHLGPYPGSVGVKAKKQWHAHLETLLKGILSQEQTQVGNRCRKFFLSAEECLLTLAATLESHGKLNVLLLGRSPQPTPPRDSDILSPGIRILFCKIIFYSQIMPASLNVNIFYNLGALIKIKINIGTKLLTKLQTSLRFLSNFP